MKKLLQPLLILIIAVVLFQTCRNLASQKTANNTAIKVQKDSVSYFKNKLGQEVADKLTYKGTAEELELSLEIEKSRSKQFAESTRKFKKLYNATKIELELKIDSVDIPFQIPVDYNFTRNFYKKTDLYTFSGIVNQNGINLSSLSTATITPVTGRKNIGFLKWEDRTEITSSNKLLKVKDFSNFNFQSKQKRFGIGFSFGFGLYANGFFVGPSINYNVIEF